MTQVAQIIGGAGTGKTRRLLDLMAQVQERGVDAMQIGFVSFTRAARREASERAADRFGRSCRELEEDGWFKTLHSICYRCTGARGSTLIADDRKSQEWIAEHVGEETGGLPGADGVDAITEFAAKTDADRALSIWGTARNRLETFEQCWKVASAVSDRTPDLGYCLDIVEKYEQGKRLDDAVDFPDILGLFAGYKFHPRDGAGRCSPIGEIPRLPVWFFDEQQDTSALLDAVCRRLIEPAKWVYVVGDFFQSIYSFGGADPKYFMAWDKMGKREIMPKTYRCPPAIQEFGEEILRQCTDYWDRKIAPADHEGHWYLEQWGPTVLDVVDPRESWLLLARTNHHASKIACHLQERGIPWIPTRGGKGGGWDKKAFKKVARTLMMLGSGLYIDGAQWAECIADIPTKYKNQAVLKYGAKTEWANIDKESLSHTICRDDIEWYGGTPLLKQMLYDGSWFELADGSRKYVAACNDWGLDAVDNPKVRVGTVHSVKGSEADNVLWLTSSTRTIAAGCEANEDACNEEHRVSYVAATRARRRLVVVKELNERFRSELPT